MSTEAKRFGACGAAIVLLAAVLRFWALDTGLPHPLTRPDEEVVIEMTARVARGEPLAWGIYPPAYIHFTWAWTATGLRVAQALGVVPPGSYADIVRDHPEHALLVARSLSAFAGTLAVALLMVVTRHELGTSPALAAGVLLATSFLHARDSHAVKPDVLFSFEVVLALWAMVPLAREATVRRALLPGLMLGIATATKYPGVLLAVPLYVAALVGSTGAPWWRRVVPLPALVAGAAGALVFLASSPTLLTDAAAQRDIVLLARGLVPSSVPGSLSATVPDGPTSPYGGPWWRGLAYHATFSLRYGAGTLATVLLPLAVGWALVSRRQLLFLAGVFTIAYYVVNGLSPVTLARYMTPLLPTMALVEGALIAAAARVISGVRPPLSSPYEERHRA